MQKERKREPSTRYANFFSSFLPLGLRLFPLTACLALSFLLGLPSSQQPFLAGSSLPATRNVSQQTKEGSIGILKEEEEEEKRWAKPELELEPESALLV